MFFQCLTSCLPCADLAELMRCRIEALHICYGRVLEIVMLGKSKISFSQDCII